MNIENSTESSKEDSSNISNISPSKKPDIKLESGDINNSIVIVGNDNSPIRIWLGKNPRIDKLHFENSQLKQNFELLQKEYDQAKHEIKIHERAQELIPGDRLEKFIIPVVITIISATLAGSITPILGYLVAILLAIYFIKRFSNENKAIKPATVEQSKPEQIKFKREHVKNQIEQNEREILRLYNTDINKGEF